MKIFAKAYKRHDNALKRLRFEKAHAKNKAWSWGILERGGSYHVVRWPSIEARERERAVQLASQVLLGTTT